MQLFYSEHITSDFLELNKEESRHLIQVLRKRIGDQIWFTDGQGLKCLFELQNDHPKKTELKKIQSEEVLLPAGKLSIAIAPTKNMDRLEWFLEKATEIGMHSVMPFISSNSERKVIKLERLHKIVVAAMKQSLRYHKPILNELASFESIVSSAFEGQKFVCHLEKENPVSLQSVLRKETDCLFLVGPEGDFSESELALAIKNGFKPVSLGEYRLRTETAGVVVAQIYNQKQL